MCPSLASSATVLSELNIMPDIIMGITTGGVRVNTARYFRAKKRLQNTTPQGVISGRAGTVCFGWINQVRPPPLSLSYRTTMCMPFVFTHICHRRLVDRTLLQLQTYVRDLHDSTSIEILMHIRCSSHHGQHQTDMHA